MSTAHASDSAQLIRFPSPLGVGGRAGSLSGDHPDNAAVTAGYEAWLRSWGARSTTVEGRLRGVALLAARFEDLTAVTTEDLADWLGNPAWSGWTRATYYATARSLYGWLHEQGVIDVNPVAKLRPPRKPKPRPRPLSDAEVAKAMAAADEWEAAWLQLALFAGLRAHEIAKIRGEEVTQEFLRVYGKGGKEAYIPTHPQLWELAQTFPRHGWWFPGGHPRSHHRDDVPINRRTVTNRISALFKSVGVEGSIHRARHAYATRLLRAGVNIRVVQTLMRHESMTTTAVYLGVDEDERRAAVGLLSL